MTPALLVIGALLVFWASMSIAIFIPSLTFHEKPNEQWIKWTDQETVGNDLYVRNGCSYCHSQYIRKFDWGLGSDRFARQGDYYDYHPIILGTERTGPDLSQDGGEHPDQWHQAHFANPRWTRPMSLMPSWEFLGQDDISKLTAFIQSRYGKNAQLRVARQNHWNTVLADAYRQGPDKNIEILHSYVPRSWRYMPNPYPADESALSRGETIYQQYCTGCHGPMGDGNGPAARYITSPPPLNFTLLKRHLVGGKYIGGLFYYQVMNGITGSAMPYFKKELESEKIWDVSNYVAVQFLGYTDAGIAPEGIDASYEPAWTNPYLHTPTTQGATQPVQTEGH